MQEAARGPGGRVPRSRPSRAAPHGTRTGRRPPWRGGASSKGRCRMQSRILWLVSHVAEFFIFFAAAAALGAGLLGLR